MVGRNDLPLMFLSPPSSSNRHNLCQSTMKLFHNVTEVNLAIEANIHFHQRLGNLKSIMSYLDEYQQLTLDALNVQFLPKSSEVTTPASNMTSDKDADNRGMIEYLQEYYATNNVKRGGYGQPLPGKLLSKYSPKIIQDTMFEGRWINVIEPPTNERYTAGMGPVGPQCSNKLTFSPGTYEEKKLCIPTTPSTLESRNNDDCNILSIGSNDQWGFEIEVTQQLPGCVTHTFDCTLSDNTPKKKPMNDDINFYPYCIGSSENQGPTLLPYDKLWDAVMTRQKDDNNHTVLESRTKQQSSIISPPKLLKMDIEGYEFDVLHNLLSSSDSSIWPEQIMLEVHWATRMVGLQWMPRTLTAGEISLFFGGLFNFGGYMVVDAKKINGCHPCLEVLLVRVLC